MTPWSTTAKGSNCQRLPASTGGSSCRRKCFSTSRPAAIARPTSSRCSPTASAGVCRDFSHLGITLCRALNIPARAVSAYAFKLQPPDFHAVFEVFLDGGWWLVDPTRLAHVDGMVRIGVGRDAADVAFLSTTGPCMNNWQEVIVEQA